MREIKFKLYQIHELSEEARRTAIKLIANDFYEYTAKHNTEEALKTINKVQAITGVTGEVRCTFVWDTYNVKVDTSKLPKFNNDIEDWKYAVAKINEMESETYTDKLFKRYINSYKFDQFHHYTGNMANVYWTFMFEIENITVAQTSDSHDIYKYARDKQLEFFNNGIPFKLN